MPEFGLWAQLEEDIYIEIKGFETELDRSKWKKFPYKLIILKKKEILSIKKREFKKENLKNYIREVGQDGNVIDC